nr:MAG: hypothetical protein [Bacteriophage sp.]
MDRIEFNSILEDIIFQVLCLAWDYNGDGDVVNTEDVINIVNLYKKK